MKLSLLLFTSTILLATSMAEESPYMENGPELLPAAEENQPNEWQTYFTGGLQSFEEQDVPNEKRSQMIYVFRRSCIRRGGSCDHRPNDCCFNSSCRCNLWGSNCRCQKAGLFQKWG